MSHIRFFALLTAVLLTLSGCGKDKVSSGGSSPDSAISGGGELGSSSGSGQEESSSSQADSQGSSVPPADSQPESRIEDGGDSWMLALVNKEHSIEKEFDIELSTVQGYNVDARIASSLEEMLAAAKADGCSLAIISGYRTIERSRILYTNEVQAYRNRGYSELDAQREAAKWVAPPGTSEHHTGLAVDIVSANYYSKYADLTVEFEKEPEAVWLKNNAPRFGFVLRFPKDKTEITTINFEPWHFRYVGVEHAAAITEEGLCLEEYLQQLSW